MTEIPGATPVTWTPERRDLVRRLWAEGRSAGQIATTLGDVTRNAVLSIVHRMKLASRPTPIGRRGTGPAQARPPQRRTPAASSPRVDAPRRQDLPQRQDVPRRQYLDEVRRSEAEGAAAVARRGMRPLVIDAAVPSRMPDRQEPRGCRWPIGDGPDWRFCQKAQAAKKPYCPAHCAIAYRRAEDL